MDDGSPRAFSVPSGLVLVTLRSNKWVLEIVDGSLKKGIVGGGLVWFGSCLFSSRRLLSSMVCGAPLISLLDL
jgi:hypothetical protein